MKTFINYLIKFIQSISLVIIIFSSIMLLTIFNKHYIYDLLENNNYYTEIFQVAKESVVEYLEQSGLPDDILDNVITQSVVTDNVNKSIEAFYNNKDIVIDTSDFETKLTDSINTYIEDNNIRGTSSSTITTLVNELISIYKNEVSYNNILEKVRSLFSTTLKYIKLALGISILAFIVSYIINRFLFKERNFIVSFFTCFLILEGFVIYVKSSIDIANISFYNVSISAMIKEFIESILYNISLSAVIIFSLGIFLALFSSGVFKSLYERPKVFHSMLLVIWMIVIFSFSQANGDVSAKTSDLVTTAVVNVTVKTNEISHDEYKKKLINSTFLIRKSAHFMEYMLLGILILLLLNDYGKLNKRMIISALLFCILYACSDEVHQLFIDGRSSRMLDVAIDSAGSLLGIIIYCIIKNALLKKRSALILE